MTWITEEYPDALRFRLTVVNLPNLLESEIHLPNLLVRFTLKVVSQTSLPKLSLVLHFELLFFRYIHVKNAGYHSLRSVLLSRNFIIYITVRTAFTNSVRSCLPLWALQNRDVERNLGSIEIFSRWCTNTMIFRQWVLDQKFMQHVQNLVVCNRHTIAQCTTTLK